MRLIHMLVQKEYKPGDQAPDGYLAWQEWAETQHKAGLKQKACGRCGIWKFPQQLSETQDQCTMQSRNGPVVVTSPVCNDCAPTTAPTPSKMRPLEKQTARAA